MVLMLMVLLLLMMTMMMIAVDHDNNCNDWTNSATAYRKQRKDTQANFNLLPILSATDNVRACKFMIRCILYMLQCSTTTTQPPPPAQPSAQGDPISTGRHHNAHFVVPPLRAEVIDEFAQGHWQFRSALECKKPYERLHRPCRTIALMYRPMLQVARFSTV